ncbi:MAG TPA: RagB/SusD family nutrient uptake outer membrane protein, partial [Chitinophaga sp.]|uniref:RagB/SusD family nutrient uptake outer membrane protein n=1 Tax=Chitinophaga sp. TaxID=1869181 RepID=UPI002C530949
QFQERGVLGVSNGITQNNVALGYSNGQFNVYEKLYRKFEVKDVRRDWAIAAYRYAGDNGPDKVNWTDTQIYNRKVGKFRREYEPVSDKVKNETGTNQPLLRYADVLLMAAEAENEINGPSAIAYQYLNEVRARAKASLITGISDRDAFRSIIQDERYRELCFEGFRRNDLIRWGILVPTMKALANSIAQTAPVSFKYASRAGDNISDKHKYLPIPQRELALDNLLKQNPGW